jgi:hypothetical protein
MTLSAIGFNMSTDQRECRKVMIKDRFIPRICCMANRAIVRIVQDDMIGIYRALKISLMAPIAFNRCARVLSIDVALCTLHLKVFAYQWIICLIVNRKFRGSPGISSMAFRARRNEEIRPVLWRSRLHEVLFMTSIAVRRRS